MSGRLPLSGPFAHAGFSRREAEVWRRAGFGDADEAAAWRAIESERSPSRLHELARRGFTPEQVAAFDDPDGPVIDLRDGVLRNLHRDAPWRWAAALSSS